LPPDIRSLKVPERSGKCGGDAQRKYSKDDGAL